MQLRIEKRMFPHVPWPLLGVTLAVAAMGVWNLASAARPPSSIWVTQTVYLGIGFLAMVAVATVDLRFIQRMVIPIYAINILALIALRFIGHKAKGAESWFVLGPIRVQPAEFMKIGVLLFLAKYFHDTYRPNDDRYGLARLTPAFLIMGLPFVLVLVQPDLGTALMIFLSSLTVFLFARPKTWILVALGVSLIAGSAVIWNDYIRDPTGQGFTLVRKHLKKHQSQRISGWLDPESDLRGANYHAAQSRIAVGSGGLAGKGWRQGTQTALSFLPEQHTDFIFSVWAEEHGFLACFVLIVLYGLFIAFTLGVAFNARDRFGAFLAVGIAALIFWHVMENIGMVVGLLPVTGITLPLMSYGGSSIVSVMMMIGLLVNVSMRRHMF